VIASTDKGVVVGLSWREAPSSTQREMFQVLRLRAGQVVDMADHLDRRAAMKAVGAAA